MDMTVNHENGNKKDNRPKNLTLMSDSQQHVHRVRVLKNGLKNSIKFILKITTDILQ